MNDPIKEIIIQTLGKDGIIASRVFGQWTLSDEQLEKFAELIVRECAKVVDDKLDFENASGPDDWASGADVLEHFGVEE